METFRKFLRLQIGVYLRVRTLKNNLLKGFKSKRKPPVHVRKNFVSLKEIIIKRNSGINNSERELIELVRNGYRVFYKAWHDVIHWYLMRRKRSTSSLDVQKLEEYADDPVRMELSAAEFRKRKLIEDQQYRVEEKLMSKKIKIYLAIIVFLLVIIHLAITH